MARSPEQREDLLADATAMPLRGEFTWGNPSELCVIGFRSHGAASIYFGEQPVLHFDASGLLRRIFHENQQILASRGKLRRRVRTGDGPRMQGVLEPLDAGTSAQLLRDLSGRLAELFAAVATGEVVWGRSTVPAGELKVRVAKLAEAVGESIVAGDL